MAFDRQIGIFRQGKVYVFHESYRFKPIRFNPNEMAFSGTWLNVCSANLCHFGQGFAFGACPCDHLRASHRSVMAWCVCWHDRCGFTFGAGGLWKHHCTSWRASCEPDITFTNRCWVDFSGARNYRFDGFIGNCYWCLGFFDPGKFPSFKPVCPR